MSGGVRDLEDLRQRCRIDAETGCWLVRGARHKGSVGIWLPQLGKSVSLTYAMAWLLTGKPAPKGHLWVATCGNTACGNPAHRKLGTRALLMRVMRPTLDPVHRAKIQRSHLKRVAAYSPELRAEIMASPETGSALARKLGLHPSTVSHIRRGETWQPVMPAASVFSLAASLRSKPEVA